MPTKKGDVTLFTADGPREIFGWIPDSKITIVRDDG